MNTDQYKAYFQTYCTAFNAQDTDGIADLYLFPVEFISEGKRHEFADRQALIDNLYKLLGIYQRIGVSSVLFRLVEEESNDKFAMIHWTMLNAENRMIIDFKTCYLFARKQQLINCVEVFDEPEKLRKLLSVV